MKEKGEERKDRKLVDMNIERAKVVRELYMKHALEGEGGEWIFYKKEEIVRLLTENGLTEEEARKLLDEHEDEIMLPYFRKGILLEPTEGQDYTQIPTYEMMDECDLAEYYLTVLAKQVSDRYNENTEKFIIEGIFDETDETEKLVRRIFADSEHWFITKHKLTHQLMSRGKHTREEAEKIINKYQERKVLGYSVEYVDVKQYRLKKRESVSSVIDAFQESSKYNGGKTQTWVDEDLLLCTLTEMKTETDVKKFIEKNTENLETRTTCDMREGYEIKCLEDLLLDWASACRREQKFMREAGEEEGSKYAIRNIEFKDIREIFKEAYTHGKKTLTYKEITSKIAQKLGLSQKESEEAFWATLSTLKIWPAWEKNKGKKWEEKEYWWGGTCDYHPPRPSEY
nr:hypothetical protein [Candidatus Freyarchaeota archaeon]